MEIRPATFADLPALRDLMVHSMAALGKEFYPPDRAEAAARYLTVPDEGLIQDGTLIVAEEATSPLGGKGRALIGVGGWSSRRKLFTGSAEQEGLIDRLDPHTDSARIRAFFVAPEAVRRGVARTIYERCEREAHAAGFHSFVLMATQPGVPLYRSLGFEEERSTTIVLPDGTGLKCVEMKKSLR